MVPEPRRIRGQKSAHRFSYRLITSKNWKAPGTHASPCPVANPCDTWYVLRNQVAQLINISGTSGSMGEVMACSYREREYGVVIQCHRHRSTDTDHSPVPCKCPCCQGLCVTRQRPKPGGGGMGVREIGQKPVAKAKWKRFLASPLKARTGDGENNCHRTLSTAQLGGSQVDVA